MLLVAMAREIGMWDGPLDPKVSFPEPTQFHEPYQVISYDHVKIERGQEVKPTMYTVGETSHICEEPTLL